MASRTRTRWFYRLALFSLMSIGIVLGIWHHVFGVRSLWIFRNGEPLSSWMIILAGPLSTLPAVLLAILRQSWGAGWLIGGGLFSLGVVIATEMAKGEPTREIANAAVRYSTTIALPMVLLGLGLVCLHRRARHTPPPPAE
jgi:hypothetical protein